MAPRTLALWEAFYRVEPWGSDYQRSAVQAQLTETQIAIMAAANGQKWKTQELKAFMPARWVGEKPLQAKKPVGRKQLRAASQLCAAIFPTAGTT